MARLVTTVDLDEEAPDHRRISVSALLETELTDGRRVPLLDDRGWTVSGPSDIWARMTEAEMAETARTVVGPDEPRPGRTQADASAEHWGRLAGDLLRYGIRVSGAELERLRHDVVLSEPLLTRLDQSGEIVE